MSVCYVSVGGDFCAEAALDENLAWPFGIWQKVQEFQIYLAKIVVMGSLLK